LTRCESLPPFPANSVCSPTLLSFVEFFTAAAEGAGAGAALIQLHALLKPLLLRRTIADVPSLALPPLSEVVVKCAMTPLQRKVGGFRAPH
jgi:SNF2 family DNA or RNA helicase